MFSHEVLFVSELSHIQEIGDTFVAELEADAAQVGGALALAPPKAAAAASSRQVVQHPASVAELKDPKILAQNAGFVKGCFVYEKAKEPQSQGGDGEGSE